MSDRPRVIAAPPASSEEAGAACAEAIRRGEIIVIPTDTVYGIAADPFDEDAVLRLYEAKGRPRDMAIPVLAVGHDAMRLIRGEPSAEARELFERFWPGVLTVVVPCVEDLPDALTAGRSSVGLRVPASDLARGIISACGGLLATTSANYTTEAPACEVAELAPALVEHVSIVVDGGRCPGGVASTVVDLTSTPPRIIRQGPVSASDLRQVLPHLAEK
ncbi:MAG: L-threonylcarbamoyladenylate synthase [Armatimonadota bacterium]|nr:L-threonylcarbamoyladenylate synthase [Armatimonadota bacterium]